jgi:hypothetical protein
MRKTLQVAALAGGLLALAGNASATPVTFQGGTFDVAVSAQGGNVYRFVYTANFVGWDDTTTDDFISAIDFGLVGWNDIASVNLVSDTAPGTWAAVEGNASANDCNISLNQFKVCAQESPLLLSASTENNQVYSWTIDVTYNTIGSLSSLTSDQNPIMAVFAQLDCKTQHGETTCAPKSTGNMSTTTTYGSSTSTSTSTSTTTGTSTTTTSNSTDTTNTSGIVPEPTLLSLLGAGLVMAGGRLRRKTAQPAQV